MLCGEASVCRQACATFSTCAYHGFYVWRRHFSVECSQLPCRTCKLQPKLAQILRMDSRESLTIRRLVIL